MRQVRQALRPGGRFIITVPQYQWMWSTLDELVHHKRRYGARDLEEKLQRAGFEVIYRTSFVTALFPLMLATRLIDRARRRTGDPKSEFSNRVGSAPIINAVLDWIMRLDEAALKAGATLPWGGSLLVVARPRPPQP
jgi:hypothetical protein